MAYADYTFYTADFHGNKISETDYPYFAERASEYLDSLSGRITYRIISDLFGGYLFIRLCGVHDLCTSTAGFGKADLVGLGKAQTVEIFRCTLRKIRIIRFGNLIAMKISSVKRVISISHSLHLRFACRILYRNCIDDFLNDCVLLACRPEVNAKFGGISF